MDREADNKDILVIGIAGGTGSGKTTLIEKMVEFFKEDVTVLSHDSYYKPHHNLTYEERTHLNYDHPDSLETDLMVEHIKQLKKGKEIECPVYDFTIHDRSSDVKIIRPSKVLIVEGILILHDKRLCDQMDIKIFVDTDADVRIIRRILRDHRERARSLDSVIDQYLTTVKPMHEKFVEPSKKNADIIIPEGGYNLVALGMIIERVRAHLGER